MNKSIAISVKNVHKEFKLAHEKSATLKSHFTNIFTEGKRTTYEIQHALRGISFEVRKGEFFGIVGRNGSGKSTMLKMLAEIYQPTKGEISVRGKLVPFIELGVGFNPELTGRENVYLNGALLGFSKDEINEFYDEVVEFAELERFMDQQLKNYSSGMQVRLAFSMAIRAKADILLIDEILAVGDADFQRKCFEYFRNAKKMKKTVIFVGHDMSAIREYCDRGILIEDGEIIVSGGSDKIANAYTRMFIEQEKDEKQKELNNNDTGTRHGDKRIKFEKVDIIPNKILTDRNKSIKLRTTINSYIDSEDILVGFKVKSATGTVLFGTNNKLLKKEIKSVYKNEKITFEWLLPNILNDGTYDVDVAIVSATGEAYDWWEEALSFQVARESVTGFLVSPEVSLEMKKER